MKRFCLRVGIFSLVPKLHLGTHLLRQFYCRSFCPTQCSNRIAPTIPFPNGVGVRGKVLLFIALLLSLTATAHGDPILPNGDFEQADPANPNKAAHWDLTDGLGVRWADAPVLPGAPPHGKAIRMDTSVTEIALMASYTKAGLTQWLFPHPQNNPISVTYGLSLYSDPVPIIPGKIYHVGFDYLADKGTMGILWMRGYGNVNGEKKRLYEGKVDCIGGPAWKHFTGVFHPTRHTPNVTEFKIMLYAYWPDGVAWFDNVELQTEGDPSATPVTAAPNP